MTIRLLTACATAALTVGTMAMTTEARAQQLPGWNLQTICSEDSSPDHCGFLEGQARMQISQQWQFIPSLVRERCLADSGEQGTQSWRLFGDCLATAARPPQPGVQVAQATTAAQASDAGGLDEIQAIRAELEAARARVEELDAQSAANVQGAAGSAAQMTALQAELEQAEAQRAEGEARIAELQEELTAATAAQATVASDAEAGMAEMRASLDEAIARADGAELRAAALQDTLAAANAQAAEGMTREADTARIAELEEALAKATTESQRGNARIEGLQTRLVEMGDAAGSAPGQNPEQIAALEASLASAEAENQRSALRIEELRGRIVELMDALMADDPAQADAPDAGRIAELETSLAEAEAANARSAARIEELTAAPAASMDGERITELEASLASAQTEVTRADARIEGLQARLVEALDASAQATAPSDAPDTRDERIVELETSLSEAQGEVDRLASRIEGLQARLISTRNSVSQAQAAFGDATAAIAEKDARIATLETDLAKAQSDMRGREVRIDGLQQRLMESADARDAGAADTDGLAGRLGVAESRIENLTTRLRNARDEGRTARDDLARARSDMAALEEAKAEERRMAEEQATAENDARGDDAAVAQRLQALLDNQRERSARVADIVAQQRGRIGEMEIELRDLRRAAQNAVVQTALVQPAPEPVPSPEPAAPEPVVSEPAAPQPAASRPDEARASCAQRIDEITASGGIQFAINTAELRADALGVVDDVIAAARTCEDARLTVRGHTDAIGERSYNVYLSQLRAAAVVDYMERNGIAPDRVSSVGVGPDEPVADNRTRAGRAANRRIEIVVE